MMQRLQQEDQSYHHNRQCCDSHCPMKVGFCANDHGTCRKEEELTSDRRCQSHSHLSVCPWTKTQGTLHRYWSRRTWLGGEGGDGWRWWWVSLLTAAIQWRRKQLKLIFVFFVSVVGAGYVAREHNNTRTGCDGQQRQQQGVGVKVWQAWKPREKEKLLFRMSVCCFFLSSFCLLLLWIFNLK